jgi:hypothetical protein
MHNMKIRTLLAAVFLLLAISTFAQSDADFKGAYELNEGSTKHVLIFSDDYYVHAAFDPKGKTFNGTEGGPFKIEKNNLLVKMEFDSKRKENVDSIFTYPLSIGSDYIEVSHSGKKLRFTRIDNGTGAIAGNWRISGRQQQGKFSPMPAGARKTIKILSGSRFQWIALNAQSKEFFGTGGGTYTFANGKYTETIDFFPRDSTRVGSSLSFDDRTEDGEWYHTGKSSAGEPLFEVWKKASVIVE